MTTLKSQTVEKEKTRRRKRVGMPDNPMSDMMGDNAGDNDDNDNDDDDDIMPPPTPGVPSMGHAHGHKDGDIVKPLPDGKMPDAPEGFTVVTKDNGMFVLRKRRYRDLKKVGIGGFQAKTRTPKHSKKDEQEGEVGPDGQKPKKRPAWRPKKNKLLVQYPEYIQDAFFGREIMDGLDQNKNPEDFLDETPHNPKAPLDQSASKSRLRLSKDILQALEETKIKEEKEKKAREAEEAKQKAKAAAKAVKASDNPVIKSEKKGDEKMDVDDDLLPGDEDLLPSDLFGDDIFKIMNDPSADGDLGEIDDSALDDAEKADNEDNDMKNEDEDSKASNDLADALSGNCLLIHNPWEYDVVYQTPKIVRSTFTV